MLNPQARFGADVMSRIAAEADVRKAGLHELLDGVRAEWGIDRRTPVVTVGNTVMAHFLFGKSPAGLGAHPYRSALPRRQVLSGSCGGMRLQMPPLLGRFVGSDCCAALLASGIHRSTRPSLLVDAGTNGEVALGDRDGILVCSTAAGPAFEGATLECGSLAQPGAVRSVEVRGRTMQARTVGNRPARSICGSGVLDAVAAGLILGRVTPHGRLVGGAKRLVVAGDVYLSQGDIREVQLAVGAVAAGIRLLLKSRNATVADIGRIVLTGRFGAALNHESAFRVGLLPRGTVPVRQHGNLALRGAVACALRPTAMAEAEELAADCREVMLSGRPDFEEEFVAAMEMKPWN